MELSKTPQGEVGSMVYNCLRGRTWNKRLYCSTKDVLYVLQVSDSPGRLIKNSMTSFFPESTKVLF